MKVTTKLDCTLFSKSLWSVLLDFTAYPSWNPFYKNWVGKTEIDSSIHFTRQLRGEDAVEFNAIVTGNNPGKYFSWECNHRIGSWWSKEEHVYRSKERNGLEFHHEIFITGFSLRFGRRSTEMLYLSSMRSMQNALEDQLKLRN